MENFPFWQWFDLTFQFIFIHFTYEQEYVWLQMAFTSIQFNMLFVLWAAETDDLSETEIMCRQFTVSENGAFFLEWHLKSNSADHLC